MSDIHSLLRQYFGFEDFLEGQESVVQSILQGEDTVVVMPTGGGKSLCYQLPALKLDGITLVVSPLIALMKDQVDRLLERKIPATVINSTLTPSEMDDRIRQVARGDFRLVYVAPERFKSERFVRTIAPLSISLFAIDEAHCISQWGHDFRPDYLRLKWALRDLGHPPVMALTATATPEVRDDIIEQLSLGKEPRRPPQVFVSGFARHNLTLETIRTKNTADKLDHITDAIAKWKTGIVYCATRKNVEKVSTRLRAAHVPVVAYHAGMTETERSRAQERFMSKKCSVAVATNAFGMGIDRSDLRFVVHYDIPGSLEAYYQEAGRAGRDGEPSVCKLLFNYADVRTQEFFIEGANPTKPIIHSLYLALHRLCGKGGLEMSISEIAEHVGDEKNEMAVGTALYMLERAGFIERGYQPGSRTYTTQLTHPIKPFASLEIDFDRLDAKRERDFGKLQRMIRYADTRDCRHHYILNYFGDAEASKECSICDNCQSSHHSPPREPNEKEMVMIQKALSCVARVNGRYGRGRIVQTLAGSRSSEVMDAGLHHLSTYGLLSELAPNQIWSLLDTLLHADCLEVSEGDYPTLSLTPLGGQVMRRQTTIKLPLSAFTTEKTSRKTKGQSSSAKKSADVDLDYDSDVFDALKKWRRKKSADLGDIPAFHIFSDAVLKLLAYHLPETEGQLLTIRGIGPAKARQFGEETLQVIRTRGVDE